MSDSGTNANPYEPTDVADTILSENRWPWSIHLGFFIWSTLLGIVAAVFPELPPLGNMIIQIPLTVLMFRWCRQDGQRFGIQIGGWTALGLFFVFPIPLTIHCFRTRGAKGILKLIAVLAYAGLMFAVTMMTFLLTNLVLYGNLDHV